MLPDNIGKAFYWEGFFYFFLFFISSYFLFFPPLIFETMRNHQVVQRGKEDMGTRSASAGKEELPRHGEGTTQMCLCQGEKCSQRFIPSICTKRWF